MLLNELPAIIQPEKICRAASSAGDRMVGEIQIGMLNNIPADLQNQKATPIEVSLTFAVDEEGYCYIAGELKVDLNLSCQRCLQPMTQVIQSPILVSPVVSDQQAKQLPPRYEPLLMQNGEVVMAQWIAEELYLALPLVPRHDSPCKIGVETDEDGSVNA